MKWLIHDNVFGFEEQNSFTTCLDLFGMEYELVNTYDDPPDGDILRCSINMAKMWRRHPGLMCNFEAFRCKEYFNEFDMDMIHEGFAFALYGELLENPDHFFGLFQNKDERIFIKPDSGGKTFDGELINRDELLYHRERYGTTWSDETLIVVAEPAKLGSEYRLVVIGDEVVAGSRYLVRSFGEDDILRIGKEHNAWRYAQRVLNKVDYRPDPAFVIDVAKTKDRGWKVIEINSFSSSGFYDADPKPIIQGLTL